jgi:hypothetical protein
MVAARDFVVVTGVSFGIEDSFHMPARLS